MTHGALVLLRHGESVYNAAQVFTGLLDVGLTGRGEEQARTAGRLLRAERVVPDQIWTSPMRRSTATTDLLREAAGLEDIPVTSSWRLAERDYGSLTGVSKAEARGRHGPQGYLTVRRTLDGAPPPATAEQVAAWTEQPYTMEGPACRTREVVRPCATSSAGSRRPGSRFARW